MGEAFRTLFSFAVPLYVILIGAEIMWSHLHHYHYYSTKGTLVNIYLSLLNFLLDLGLRGLGVLAISYCYRFHVVEISTLWIYWLSLLVLQDLLFYFMHRVDHFCRLFWAVHVTHHSSEEFNMTVGFRSSVLQPLYHFFWFIPLSFFGYRTLDIMLMYSITQIYGILIHTRAVGKLGPLEWVMATPSHHRVHHASNVNYLDKNLGMVFIVWDRLFGTFVEEQEEARYGLTHNIETSNWLQLVFHEWISLYADLKKPSSLKAKFIYVFGPPGWSHDGSKLTSKQLRELEQVKKT
jgi:sterol desaturase/sphingolipid hydroxylase (fatty acid hydroxylase superfamily)